MRNVATLVNFLSRSGFSVTVVTMEGNPSDRGFLDESVDWLSLNDGIHDGRGDRFTKKLRLSARLRRHLRHADFDLLYVIDSWTLPLLWAAGLGSLAFAKRPFVYHTYDWLEPGLAPPSAIWLEKRACRAASLVVNTDRSRARMQQTLYGLQSTPMWIPNFLSRDDSIPACDKNLRKAWFGEIEKDLKILIYPSVASSARLTKVLIRAFAILPKEYVLVTFRNKDTYGAECVELSAKLELNDRVRFMSPVPYQELLPMVASADVGAIFHDSQSSSGYFMANADRLGLFVACGVPFVASDFPNVEAIVYRHNLGVCCSALSESDIADSIIDIAGDSARLEERRSAIKKAFKDSIFFEKEGGRIARAIIELAAGRAPIRG